MKNGTKLLMGVAGVAAIATAAQANFISTLTIDQADYLVSGFSSGGVPSAGPMTSQFSYIAGSYNLDIPTAGGSYLITLDSNFAIDSNRDGIVDAVFSTGPVSLGVHASPGPGTAWFATGVALPDITVEIIPGSPFTLTGASLDLDVALDGPYPGGTFGSLAHANLTVAGGNIFDLNVMLTALDNAVGGGDGIFDGFISGSATMTFSAVPAPASALSFLALGGISCSRRRRR